MFGIIQSFWRNKNGNIAMTFALTLIPIFMLIGGSVDFHRRQNYEVKLQSAVDSATLAAARFAASGDVKKSEIKAYALDYFDRNYDPEGSKVKKRKAKISNDGVISVTAKVKVPTTMLAIIGKKNLIANAHAESPTAGSKLKMEAVLVLDMSFSMSGDRLTALKEASKNFVDTVTKDPNAEVKIGIVPFNDYVSVGKNTTGTWLNKPPKKTNSGEWCYYDHDAHIAAGCTKKTYTCVNDGVEQTCTSWNCPSGALESQEKTCVTYSNTEEFNGCVRSRDEPWNYKDEKFSTKKVDGIASTWEWVAPILPLTEKNSDIEDSINGLWATRETYIAPGISWGVRVLSDHDPFDEGSDYDTFLADGGQKVMIIMSDGQNTRSANSDGWHWDNDTDEANKQTEKACKYAQDLGTEVYTVALDVDDTTTLDLLEACATSLEHFYDIEDPDELDDTFSDIASALLQVRLTK